MPVLRLVSFHSDHAQWSLQGALKSFWQRYALAYIFAYTHAYVIIYNSITNGILHILRLSLKFMIHVA